MIALTKTGRTAGAKDRLVVLDKVSSLGRLGLKPGTRKHLKEQLDRKEVAATCEVDGYLLMVHLPEGSDPAQRLERARQAGNAFVLRLAAARREAGTVISLQEDPALTLALLEGALLGAYRFAGYGTGKQPPAVKRLGVQAAELGTAALQELKDRCDAVCAARDLVNKPPSHLSAEQLGEEAVRIGKASGFRVQVLHKKQIEAEGMGGLLAVNQGSLDPPAFIIMEWKPKDAVNAAPIVLVGKGVTYDTGGLSLKPTPHGMDTMKCDMAGGAAVIGALAATARAKLPVHVVGLVPTTDNRPGGKAFAPGDVLKMHSGLTVENLNSDAEGRLILADALSYGERWQAETVITIATLTGAAVRAIGTLATVTMGTAPEEQFHRLEAAAALTHERVARMPFWDEYAEELKSDIADLKNIGGPYAGQITAGKFLARFTTRPFIHLDIAGPAFLDQRDHYRPKGGTGTGVRLLHEYIRRRAAEGRGRKAKTDRR